MRARLEKVDGPWPDRTGALTEVRMEQAAAGFRRVLTLWPDGEPGEDWYDVEGDSSGPDGDAAVAIVAEFPAPMSPEGLDAARRADQERINPAMSGHPGLVRSVNLFQPERRSYVTVVLASSIEAIEDGQRRILSLDLLPDEDPALLTGPERIDLYRVVD